MIKEALKTYLEKNFQAAKIEESFDFLILIVDKNELLEVARKLKNDAELRFDFLFCETAVDKVSNFEVIYHLNSSIFQHELELKVLLEKQEIPEISSVYELWKSADLFECEIFDLFGIKFINHPNLRRIFLGDEWIGYPLRKDYKDNINVVPL